MKSELKPIEPKQPSRDYPYLGIGNRSGKVVLFCKPDEGTLVNEGNNKTWKMGQHSHFNEFGFIPYDGSVTLSND